MENDIPTFFKFRLRLEELKETINMVKTNSSPEPDLINHFILKLIPDVGLVKLVEIFEDILDGKFFPSSWKKYIIILLQKPSKKTSDSLLWLLVSLSY